MSGQETWLDWVFKVVNFGVLVALLLKFAGKPLKELFAKRSETVRKRIDESRREMEEALELKAVYEARMGRLDQEIEEFKKSLLDDAEREKARILEEARLMAARIGEQARLMYDQEMREIERKAREEIARLTIAGAEGLLAEKLTKSDHDRMVDEFINKLGSLN